MYQRQPVEEVIEEGESLKEGFAKELAEYLYFSDRAYDEPNDVKLQEKMEKRGEFPSLSPPFPLLGCKQECTARLQIPKFNLQKCESTILLAVNKFTQCGECF